MLVPLIAVVAVITGVAYALSGMPITLGISFGFIMNAVSPGIIVAQMLGLASQGYGITNGEHISSTVLVIMQQVCLCCNMTSSLVLNIIVLCCYCCFVREAYSTNSSSPPGSLF